MNIVSRIATATSRDAGRSVVHHVYVDGVIVATRRSATNRYRFAICRWVGSHDDGSRTVVVDRWSRDSKCSSSSASVPGLRRADRLGRNAEAPAASAGRTKRRIAASAGTTDESTTAALTKGPHLDYRKRSLRRAPALRVQSRFHSQPRGHSRYRRARPRSGRRRPQLSGRGNRPRDCRTWRAHRRWFRCDADRRGSRVLYRARFPLGAQHRRSP
jgi:hypothetical protein